MTTDWDELGRPDDWNPSVKRALELIHAIYEYAPTGGPLHVILDDWNIEDGDITLAQQDEQNGYAVHPMAGAVPLSFGTSTAPLPAVGYDPYDELEENEARQVREAVSELLPLLQKMTIGERASALARHRRYLPTPTEA